MHCVGASTLDGNEAESGAPEMEAIHMATQNKTLAPCGHMAETPDWCEVCERMERTADAPTTYKHTVTAGGTARVVESRYREPYTRRAAFRAAYDLLAWCNQAKPSLIARVRSIAGL